MFLLILTVQCKLICLDKFSGTKIYYTDLYIFVSTYLHTCEHLTQLNLCSMKKSYFLSY